MPSSARSPRALRAAWLVACLLGTLALASSCSKKLTTVDPSYTTPEGRPSGDARLLVYRPMPYVDELWLDRSPYGAFSPSDVMVEQSSVVAAVIVRDTREAFTPIS